MQPVIRHINRASAYMDFARYALAETELRQVIGQMPDEASAHALLAQSLFNQKEPDKKRQAIASAQTAVRLAPNWPTSHFVLALAYEADGDLLAAEAAAQISLRLDANDADTWGLMASHYGAQNRWEDARVSAECGLDAVPGHAWCVNLRAIALTALGQAKSAQPELLTSLGNDPENPLTHAARGWGLLDAGNATKALMHFQQALRLDPFMAYARVGGVEAIRARSSACGSLARITPLLRDFLPRPRWGIVVGLYVLYNLAFAGKFWPGLLPYVLPVSAGYVTLVFFTKTTRALSDWFVRRDRWGRVLLEKAQIAETNAVAACYVITFLSFALFVLTRQDAFLHLAFGSAAFIVPLSDIWATTGRRQTRITAFCAILVVFAFGIVAQAILRLPILPASNLLCGIFFGAIFLYTVIEPKKKSDQI